MTGDAQMFYIMLALPSLFGLTLVGEGIYKMATYQEGKINIILGSLFLAVVVFGYFYLKDYLR
ncbi:MAG: hypothetical protein Q8L51_01440 [Candidatus Amesbacteria bacterium]|nr:hypothetical protein [Candidatus Amesbacteria bacterium]